MRKEPQENFDSSLALFIKQHLRTVFHSILTNTLLKINKGNQNTPINKTSIKCKLLLCGDTHRLPNWFKEVRLFPVGYKSVSHNAQYHRPVSLLSLSVRKNAVGKPRDIIRETIILLLEKLVIVFSKIYHWPQSHIAFPCTLWDHKPSVTGLFFLQCDPMILGTVCSSSRWYASA